MKRDLINAAILIATLFALNRIATWIWFDVLQWPKDITKYSHFSKP